MKVNIGELLPVMHCHGSKNYIATVRKGIIAGMGYGLGWIVVNSVLLMCRKPPGHSRDHPPLMSFLIPPGLIKALISSLHSFKPIDLLV